MPGHNLVKVHLIDPGQAIDPGVQIAVAEPRKTAHEKEVTEKGNFLVGQMDKNFTVAMSGTNIADVHDPIGAMEGLAFFDHVVWCDEFQRCQFWSLHAHDEPIMEWVVSWHQCFEIRSEEQAETLINVWDAPATFAASSNIFVHQQGCFLLRNDRDFLEGDVASGVIEVKMRIDKLGDWCSSCSLYSIPESAALHSALLGIDCY